MKLHSARSVSRSLQIIYQPASQWLSVRRPTISSTACLTVTDNTNADPETRGKWVELAEKYGIPIRCVCFNTPPSVCKHNDAVRALNEALFNPEKRTILPGMAFTGFLGRYKEPTLSEGFQDIFTVPFKFQGSEDQKRIWQKYWT